jgi:hypothetical protein
MEGASKRNYRPMKFEEEISDLKKRRRDITERKSACTSKR